MSSLPHGHPAPCAGRQKHVLLPDVPSFRRKEAWAGDKGGLASYPISGEEDFVTQSLVWSWRLFLSTALVGVLTGCPSGKVGEPPTADAMVVDMDASHPDAVVVHPDAEVHPDATEPDAEEPDVGFPDVGFPDAGFQLRSVNLQPAAGTAASTGHKLRGSLSPSTADRAESPNHKLRGTLGPLGR